MSNANLNLATVSSTLQTSKKMSAKYVWLDTEKLVNYLLGLTSKGEPVFELVDIKNSRGKTAGRGKHIVRLRAVHQYQVGGDWCQPELVIINSYDGSCPLRVEMGIFRLVCTNGMIVKSKDLGELKIRHMGTPEDAVRDIITQFAAKSTTFISAQQRLAETVLTDDQIIEFALKAAQTRWDKKFTEEDAKILLEVARPEDEGNTAWHVMNRIQEKIMAGGYKLTGQKRQAKAIKNASEYVRVNAELFQLASEYCEFEMVEN